MFVQQESIDIVEQLSATGATVPTQDIFKMIQNAKRRLGDKSETEEEDRRANGSQSDNMLADQSKLEASGGNIARCSELEDQLKMEKC